jgi:hypothetical protein
LVGVPPSQLIFSASVDEGDDVVVVEEALRDGVAKPGSAYVSHEFQSWSSTKLPHIDRYTNFLSSSAIFCSRTARVLASAEMRAWRLMA